MSEAAAGAGASYTFRLNDLFDPNFTGVGAQPLGYDQYNALFARYRVLSTRYSVCFGQRGTTPSRVGLYPSPQSTLTSDPNAWIVQNRFAKMRFMGPNTGGNNVAQFSGTLPLEQIFGVTRAEFTIEHDFTATSGLGPNRQAYLHIFTTSVSGTVAACDFTVRLWFDVEYSAPVTLGLS